MADGRHFENRKYAITWLQIVRSSPNFAGGFACVFLNAVSPFVFITERHHKHYKQNIAMCHNDVSVRKKK